MIITNVQNVDDYYFDVFVSISSAITGYATNDLLSTGLSVAYYQHVRNSIEEATFLQFLNESREILENTYSVEQMNIAIAERLIGPMDMKELFDKLATLWYLGTWNGSYVNDRSYAQGLAWKAMSAHPPGAKQPGFKSWHVKPVN